MYYFSTLVCATNAFNPNKKKCILIGFSRNCYFLLRYFIVSLTTITKVQTPQYGKDVIVDKNMFTFEIS